MMMNQVNFPWFENLRRQLWLEGVMFPEQLDQNALQRRPIEWCEAPVCLHFRWWTLFYPLTFHLGAIIVQEAERKAFKTAINIFSRENKDWIPTTLRHLLASYSAHLYTLFFRIFISNLIIVMYSWSWTTAGLGRFLNNTMRAPTFEDNLCWGDPIKLKIAEKLRWMHNIKIFSISWWRANRIRAEVNVLLWVTN